MEDLFLVTDSLALSVSIWSILGLCALYFGRSPAHRALLSLVRLGHNALRLTARAVLSARNSLAHRNREVLLAQGRETRELLISREFERITDTVHRDLARFPETQRLLAETTARIEGDHLSSIEVPQEVPGWSKVVEAVARVSTKADPSAQVVLEAIHKSLEKAEARSLSAYRIASRERHRLVSRMRPAWTGLQRTLTRMERAVDSILERARGIDRHMDEYRDIVKGTDHAVQALSTSALVQFGLASVFILIAVGGAVINFTLIARPMGEMVGVTSYIGPYQSAHIAALVLTLLQISLGLFFMESLRVTRLFPSVAALPDNTRTIMACVALTLLTTLASVEAGLAYLREAALQQELATASALFGSEALIMTNEAWWITTATQMGLGFILPFALTFVAIPLETFVRTLRHALGMLAIGLLNLLALGLRVMGNLLRQLGMLLVRLYDLIIFAPLWIEERFVARRQRRAQTEAARALAASEIPVPDEAQTPVWQPTVEPSPTGHRAFTYGGNPA